MSSKSSRRPNYIVGILTFFGVAIFTILAWYIFFNPKGIMKLYTPMYGFAMVVTLLAMVVTLAKTFEGWPMRNNLDTSIPLVKGVGLSAISLVLTWVMMFGVFHNIIGKYGVTYFSPTAIMATGEIGTEIFNARENSSTAIIYFFAVYIWLSIAWKSSFRNWPWGSQQLSVVGFSRLMTVMSFSIIFYAIFFHPHIGYLFSPPQTLSAVAPWWENIADTSSAYFNLGWVVCTAAILVMSESLWEGYPWKLANGDEGSLISGLFGVFGSVAAGIIMMYVMKVGMELYWGEPFIGGQYLDAPYFRYLHAAEMSGFLILATYIVSFYLGNLASEAKLIFRITMRTIAAIVIALLIMWFYYAAGPIFLGTVPGIAQPEDTPLCWTFLMLSIVMMHRYFFSGYPLNTRE